MTFGSILGDVWESFSAFFLGPLDLVIFVTPPVRKLYFGGSGESLFGTFSACFSESVSRPSFRRILVDFGRLLGSIWVPVGSLCRHFFAGRFLMDFRVRRGGGQRSNT